MEPSADQIDTFSFNDAWSAQHSDGVILRVGFCDGSAVNLGFPLEAVPAFADDLAEAIRLVKGGGVGGRVRKRVTQPRSTEPVEVPAYLVSGFRFETLADGLAIVADHPNGDETVILASSAQAQILADYARTWYARPHHHPAPPQA
jgi:hypothetical protein